MKHDVAAARARASVARRELAEALGARRFRALQVPAAGQPEHEPGAPRGDNAPERRFPVWALVFAGLGLGAIATPLGRRTAATALRAVAVPLRQGAALAGTLALRWAIDRAISTALAGLRPPPEPTSRPSAPTTGPRADSKD